MVEEAQTTAVEEQRQLQQASNKLPELPPLVWAAIARATLAACDSSVTAWLRLRTVSRDWWHALEGAHLSCLALRHGIEAKDAHLRSKHAQVKHRILLFCLACIPIKELLTSVYQQERTEGGCRCADSILTLTCAAPLTAAQWELLDGRGYCSELEFRRVRFHADDTYSDQLLYETNMMVSTADCQCQIERNFWFCKMACAEVHSYKRC